MDITQFFSEDSVVWHIVEFLAPFLILIITLHDERKQTAKYKRQEIKLLSAYTHSIQRSLLQIIGNLTGKQMQ